MTTAIEVAHLIKRYKESARHAIKGVNFTVESKQATSGPCARMCRKGRRQGCDGYRPCARR
ncbi:MAG: hypothetical protein LBC23_05960 [Coriobacteriales bacterium]|jgi:hypothetical protein|nr:hypothetical protein [Coriobacteriales bacterium]